MSGTFLPWWQCSALLLDGEDEVDLDIEVRAADEAEAAERARAAWADHRLDAEEVRVRRCAE